MYEAPLTVQQLVLGFTRWKCARRPRLVVDKEHKDTSVATIESGPLDVEDDRFLKDEVLSENATRSIFGWCEMQAGQMTRKTYILIHGLTSTDRTRKWRIRRVMVGPYKMQIHTKRCKDG